MHHTDTTDLIPSCADYSQHSVTYKEKQEGCQDLP